MAFDHRVHHTDMKGKVTKKTPYTLICRKGAQYYFDHQKGFFFDQGTMRTLDPSVVPDDIWDRYMKKSKASLANVAPKVIRKKKATKKKSKKIDPSKAPIVVTEEELNE